MPVNSYSDAAPARGLQLQPAEHSGDDVHITEPLVLNGDDTTGKDGEFTASCDLDLGARLLTAADQNDRRALLTALELRADLNYQDDEGRTALLWASKNGSESMVKLLLARKAMVDIPTRHGATALGLAAHKGFADVMELLMEARASIASFRSYSNRMIAKPTLLWAAEAGQTQALQFLLDRRANPYEPSSNGNTALIKTIMNKHVDAATLLIENWGDTVAPDAQKALLWSARKTCAELLQVLLDRRVDVNSADSHGVTALMWSAARGNIECVNILLQGKARIEMAANDGTTALRLAADGNHTKVVARFVSAGASLYQVLSDAERTQNFERFAPVISMGIQELYGVALHAFANRITASMVAGIICTQGAFGQSLLRKLFVPVEVAPTGQHAINLITHAYMEREVKTLANAGEIDPTGIGRIPARALEILAPQSLPRRLQGQIKQREVRFYYNVFSQACDVEVIYALATTPNNEIFDELPCRAILEQTWTDVQYCHVAVIIVQTVLVCLLCVIAVAKPGAGSGVILRLIGVAYTVFQCLQLYYFAFSGVRLACAGWSDVIPLMAFWDAPFAVMLAVEQQMMEQPGRHAHFRMAVALCSISAWYRFLRLTFSFRSFGREGLPIMEAMQGVGMLAIVICVGMAACLQAYVALAQVHHLDFLADAFLMWRVLMGDAELNDFQSGEHEQHSKAFLGDVTAAGLFLFMSAVFTVLLMNIFIGVVSESYGAARQRLEATFLRHRARATVLHMMGPVHNFLPLPQKEPQESRGHDFQGVWVCGLSDLALD